jgi:hypothetical protein
MRAAVVIPAPGPQGSCCWFPLGSVAALAIRLADVTSTANEAEKTCTLAGACGVGIVRCDTDEARPVDDCSASPG